MHVFFFFFFNDTATTEIYTFSLHDALPISRRWCKRMDFELRAVEEHCALALRIDLEHLAVVAAADEQRAVGLRDERDRKSTRLNSSHSQISYAVFCLKKKKNRHKRP